MKLCAVIAFIISSICGTAQTTSKTYKQGGRFIEVITANGRHLETRVWESDVDYNIYQQHKQPKDGWLYGVGRATDKIVNSNSEDWIKRDAQKAAYAQIAGQLERDVTLITEDHRISGVSDGLVRVDASSEGGMQSITKGKISKAGFQYSYRIDNPDGTITYVVGVGIIQAKSDANNMGQQDKDMKATEDSNRKHFFDR